MAEKYRIRLKDEELDLKKLAEEKGYTGYYKVKEFIEDVKDYDLLKKIASNSDWGIYCIPEHPMCDNTILDILASNPRLDNNGVSRIISYHKPSKELLLKLANHPRESAREELTKYEKLPKDVIRLLAKDKDENVRKYLGWWQIEINNCPFDVMRDLCNDSSQEVRKYARTRIKEALQKGTLDLTEEQLKELLPTRKKKHKKTLSERVVVETGSLGLPVKVHLIGDVDKAYQSMKNSYYGFGSPDGAYTDVYIQEAINPQDEDIDCYVGYYPGDVSYSDDDLVQEYIDDGQDDKAVARIKKLAKQNEEEIYWCAGTWDDPWSEALGGYEIDSPEAFEK